MKTPHMPIGATIALLVSGVNLLAGPTDHAEILREREAVLSKIVAEQESRHALGTADDEAVLTAHLALLAFRRDTAQSPTKKIQHQESIVGWREKAVDRMKTRSRTGVVDSLDVLQATDALLEAKQVLEELRANEEKG